MFLVPGIMYLVLPVIALLHSYTSLIPVPESFSSVEENLEIFTMGLLGNASWKIFLLNFLMIAILPSIFEEFLFRGLFQKLFTKMVYNHHIGILASGLLFGLIHGQIYKFIPIAALGVLLGYLYYWTKNLWFPILAHFFNNGIQVIFYFSMAKGWTEIEPDSMEVLPPMITLVCTVLFVGMTYLFYTVNRKTADESF